MTTEPRRLRLGALVLLLQPCEPPRLWRVCGVEGEDAAADVLLCGQVVTERDLRAALSGRLTIVAANAWRCGICGGSVSGYWSVEDAEAALEGHMERVHPFVEPSIGDQLQGRAPERRR